MSKFLTIGLIILLGIVANAQRAYAPNSQVDTTLYPRAIWQDGKLIPTVDCRYMDGEDGNFPPISDRTYPDSNFVLRSFGYPTSPWNQVMANGHLYDAQGGYIIIYEISADGLLTRVGSRTAHSYVKYIAHDGQYLYAATIEGFEIYEGTNYVEPQRVGENWLGLREVPNTFSVYGDSLYFFYKNNFPYSEIKKMGIMDISNRTNPRVVYADSQLLYYDPNPPQKYQNYLVVTGKKNADIDHNIFYILNLSDSTGIPQFVDSLDEDHGKYMITGNRFYTGDDALAIYEFDHDYHLSFRGRVGLTNYGAFIKDLKEYNENGRRYCMCSVGFRKMQKVDVTQLTSPFIVDSIVEPTSDSTYFLDVDYYNGKSYIISPYFAFSDKGDGIFVYDWNLANPNRLIQRVRNHYDCERVALYEHQAAYLGTTEGEILVLDINNIDRPQVIEDNPGVSPGYDPKVSGNILSMIGYDWDTRLYSVKAFDLSDPLHPDSVWTYQLPQDHYLVQQELINSSLVLSYFGRGPNNEGHLMIINMADPANPLILCDTILGFWARYFTPQFPILYFIDNENEWVRMVSIEDTGHPQYTGAVGVGGGGQILQVLPHNGYMYVFNTLNSWSTFVFDLAHHTYPLSRNLGIGGYMDIDNNTMFFCGYSESGPGLGVYAWNLARDPINAAITGYHSYNAQNYTYMKANYPYVFLTGGYYGLIILEYQGPTGIDWPEDNETDGELSLTAYPNPFNERVLLSYNSIDEGNPKLDIYDITGRKVWSKTNIGVGNQSISWPGRDDSGKPVSSGIYFAKLTGNNSQITKKLILMK